METKSDTIRVGFYSEEIVELHPEEMDLIKKLRKQFRFGDVTIKMKDGLPFRLVRITEMLDLDTK